jgi:hypothetical protein
LLMTYRFTFSIYIYILLYYINKNSSMINDGFLFTNYYIQKKKLIKIDSYLFKISNKKSFSERLKFLALYLVRVIGTTCTRYNMLYDLPIENLNYIIYLYVI